MGTAFHIVLYSAEEATANRAFGEAFARIAELDQALSNYKPDSELNRLCRGAPHGDWVRVSQDLWRVLHASDGLSRATDGAFDVTVGGVTKLWRRARRREALPDASQLREALASVDYRLIDYDPSQHSVRLGRAGMQLDLGGIAKGYAADEALATIRSLGITRALVNGGGDLAAGEPPPGETGWRVGIASLDPDQPAPRHARLANMAIATSGDARQFVEIGGVRYSHIIDPRTGLGVTQRSSVTVAAARCIDADGWASALSVLGPAGMELIEKRDGIEAQVIFAKDDELIEIESSGFDRLMESVEQQAQK